MQTQIKPKYIVPASPLQITKVPTVHHVLVGSHKHPVWFGRYDLGPACPEIAVKRVSKQHLQINFQAGVVYRVQVLGANGIKFDHQFYAPGEELDLPSGSILDCVGVKVLFLDESDPRVTEEVFRQQRKHQQTWKKHGRTPSLTNSLNDTVLLPSPPAEQFPKRAASPLPPPSDKKVKPEPVIPLTSATATPEDESLIDLILQTLVGLSKRTPVNRSVLHVELAKFKPGITVVDLTLKLARLPMFIMVPTSKLPNSIKRDPAYYYSPENDWNRNRTIEIGSLVPKPRGCTLSTKQYYFKPPPKLPTHGKAKK